MTNTDRIHYTNYLTFILYIEGYDPNAGGYYYADDVCYLGLFCFYNPYWGGHTYITQIDTPYQNKNSYNGTVSIVSNGIKTDSIKITASSISNNNYSKFKIILDFNIISSCMF